MKIDRVTKVVPVADERLLLDDSLRPIWMFLRWNGIVLSFGDEGKEKRAVDYFRFVLTLLILLVMMSYSLFVLYQLVFNISTVEATMDIIFLFVILVVGCYALVFTHIFISHGKEIRQFLKDWKKLEMEMSEYSIGTDKKKMIRIVYGMYAVMMIAVLSGFFFWNNMEEFRPFFLSSEPFFSSKVDLIGLSLMLTICQYYIHNLYFLGEIVPTLFFYHIGCVVDNIEGELKHISKSLVSNSLYLKQWDTKTGAASTIPQLNRRFYNDKPFHRVWEKYEAIYVWVNRANELFATFILLGYSGFFIMCSSTSFLGVKLLRKIPWLGLVFIGIFLSTLIRTVFMNRLISHLTMSCGRLKSAIALVLSRKWNILSEEDRLLLTTFQERIDKDELNASPFDLYTVSPSNLLSMLSLIVTYTIVFIQF